MKRPYTFDDIKGHSGVVQYLKSNLINDTLTHFLIIEGPEGLGKTSLADIIALTICYKDPSSDSYRKAYEEVVVKNTSNDCIKRFKCSVDGGKDVARLIKDEMHNTFGLGRPKVIICDECHGLTEQAQDVFLAETEFMDKNVYVLMLTTEITKLKASLRSRSFPIHLEPLKRAEMLQVLKLEVQERNLRIQNEDATLQMIVDWAECKPRTGLNILDAFAANSRVSSDMIRGLIGYIDAKEVTPLLKSLAGSLTYGLHFIDEMAINDSLISVVTECIKIKSGQPSYKLKMDDIVFVRDQLRDVKTEQLVNFLCGITSQVRLTKTLVVHSYIKAHQNFNLLTQPDTSQLINDENIQRANVDLQDTSQNIAKAPTLDELLKGSDVIE